MEVFAVKLDSWKISKPRTLNLNQLWVLPIKQKHIVDKSNSIFVVFEILQIYFNDLKAFRK